MTRSLRRLLTSVGFMACALGPSRAWAFTDNFCSFPTALTTWTFNGNAFEALNTEIKLTDNAVLSEASSAFLTTPLMITSVTPIHAYFTFQVGPTATGGDGIAFVMQNSAAGPAALTAAATTSGTLGYSGISPSVVVKFDTYKNGANDPSANFVAIELNGAVTLSAHLATPAFTMAGGGILHAWVDYTPSNTTFAVYLSQTATKPATALLTDAATNLYAQLGSTGQMYVGFTSSTGTTAAESNETDVYELELSTDGIPCACQGDSACSGATPACDAAGICAICSATNASGCPTATPVCNVPTNSCVGCLTNANCADPTPICDATGHTCRACTTDADCGGSTPKCDTVVGSTNVGDCVLCVTNADCGGTTPRCTAGNLCVQCLTAADCGGDTPVCSAAGTCTACASDNDCVATPSTPACEVWGGCGQCSMTNPAACTGADAICDYPSGTCVACEFNTDCSGSNPTCNSLTHVCQPCATNADCEGNLGGSACVTTGMKAGSCVVCAADADCTSPAAPHCDTTANQCVACLTSADCTAPTPVCSAAEICIGCLTSSDCSGATPVCDPTSSQCAACENDYSASNPGPGACPTAALPACQPATSPLAGQCALCSSLNDSACITVPATPVCYVATASCGCNQDTDCNPNSYCDVSTVPSGVCTTGCRVVGDAGATNCATGEYCTSSSTTVGTCMSEPCNSNADCTGKTDTVCNTIVQPHVCVVCLNDPDCPTGEVCDSTDHCVQCTPNQLQNCNAAGVGAACLASENCGCATDADCGSATSGRVCNTTSHTCAAGCHTTGGNGCPSGQTCSAADAGTTGQCTTATGSTSTSVGAGGAGGGTAGNSGNGGSGGAVPQVVTQSLGCGCRLAGDQEDDAGPFGAVAGLGLIGLLASRRRRSARASGT